MLKDNPPVHYDFSPKPAAEDWEWDVKPVAFRFAAGILFANLLISAISLLFGQIPNIIAVVLDIVLAIGLLYLSHQARGFTLFRAYAGAILLPLLAFLQHDLLTAIIMTIIQVCFSGSLILLLQGETKRWKLITASIIFGVFCFGINICLMSVLLLAKATLK
jgi:hypothetical protein